MNLLLLATRLLFVLGIVNLSTGLLIFFSCRCLPGSRFGGNLMKHTAYQRFFKLHCHIWKIFWPSVIIHASLALAVIGWPA
ncbi:MAG: hypothetical protein V1691_02600 [Chloroflexota bacterium]